MSSTEYGRKYPAIEENARQAAERAGTPHAANAFTPPIPTGTPEWVQQMKEKYPETWDVRIVQQALDLFAYNDGVFWVEGTEGAGEERYYNGSTSRISSTPAWQAPFWREAWVDAMPDGTYQLVTDKVCAIGSIQLFIGGGDDNADYNTIIQRLNNISQDFKGHDGIVSTNDSYGREEVMEVMKEYVRRHGGEKGHILPDFKPLVRFDKPTPNTEQEVDA